MPFGNSIPFGGGPRSITPENFVRPFQDKPSVLPSPPRPPKVVVGEPDPSEDPVETPGLLAWGEAGSPSPIEDMLADKYMSDKIEGQPVTSHEDFTVTGLKKKKKAKKKAPQDDRPGVISGDEIDRQTLTFKVYNPDDAEQWVKVQAVKSIRFRLSDTDQRYAMQGGDGDEKGKNAAPISLAVANLSGKILKLNLRPPPPPPKPSTSSS